MYNISTTILKLIILLIGLVVLVLCIFVLPKGIISENASMYRPLLIGMYIPAIPFFIALYQGFKLLQYINKKNIFSELSIKALGKIKYCAIVICVLYIMGMPYIFYLAQRDDAPGVAAIGFIFIFTSLVVATASAIFQKILKNVADIKSENDLII